MGSSKCNPSVIALERKQDMSAQFQWTWPSPMFKGLKSTATADHTLVEGYPQEMELQFKSYRRFLRLLDDGNYLLDSCRKMDWKQVLKTLTLMLNLLNWIEEQDDGLRLSKDSKLSEKREIIDRIRRQLHTTDAGGNHCLHIMCYLKPSSNRILRLVLQIAAKVDCLPSMCCQINRQGSTPLLAACTFRSGHPHAKLLLRCSAMSFATILKADRNGRSPFVALVQGYELHSKIPALSAEYYKLNSIGSSLEKNRCDAATSAVGVRRITREIVKDCRGMGKLFPLLWKPCCDLIDAAWRHAFPHVPCPSLLHGAALVAAALPPSLTDLIFRTCALGRDTSSIDHRLIQQSYALLDLVIEGTVAARSTAYLACQIATLEIQSLHFARRLMKLCSENTFEIDRSVPTSSQPQCAGSVFRKAIQAGLPWNSNERGISQTDSPRQRQLSAMVNTIALSKFTSCTSAYGVPTAMNQPDEEHSADEICSSGWLQELVVLCPDVLREPDPSNGLLPFQLAASAVSNNRMGKEEHGCYQLDTIYNLIRACPEALARGNSSS